MSTPDESTFIIPLPPVTQIYMEQTDHKNCIRVVAEGDDHKAYDGGYYSTIEKADAAAIALARKYHVPIIPISPEHNTVINFNDRTIGNYEVTLYPVCIGQESPLTAMIYLAGTQHAVWECLPQEDAEAAFKAAQEWIDQQPK